jgi:hypothetical protein
MFLDPARNFVQPYAATNFCVAWTALDARKAAFETLSSKLRAVVSTSTDQSLPRGAN